MGTATNNIIIKINAETTKATEDIKRLTKQINVLNATGARTTKGLKAQTKAVDQTSRSFASLTKHVSQLALIYGAFQGLQTTVRTFANFEESVTRLGVVSGATSEELKQLSGVAQTLGETTIFTASQVADGMNAMAMAGLTAEESLAGIASTLDLSAVGMISVEESALIATTAMNGFKLEAQDIGRISDVMAKTVTTSATTVQELGNAYEKVASVATQFDVSLETTTAALGTLADAGRRGSEAGTQLKIVMNRMAGNKEAAKFIKQLGVDIYDSTGKILPFTTQLQNMKVELDKLDAQSRNIKMAEIFGTEALASANILLSDIDAVIAKTAELEDAYGFASSSAKKMMDNLMGDYKELQSAMEGLVLKIGDELSPVLREALDEATEFIQTLDPDDVRDFGEGVGELVELMFDLVKSLLNVVGNIKELSATFASITGISGAMQVQLLLLGKSMTILYKIGVNLTKTMLATRLAIAAATGATVTYDIVTKKAVIGVRTLTFAQVMLNRAMKANPIGLALVAVGSLFTAYQYLSHAYDDVNKAVKQTDDAIKKNGEIISTTKDELLALDTASRQAFNDYTRDQITKTEKAIASLSKQIKIEKKEFWTNHDAVAKNEAKLAQLVKTKEGLLKQEQTLIEVNKEAIKIAKDKKDKIEAEAEATKALIKEKESLGEAETKAYNKAIKSLNDRVIGGKNALLTLYDAEQKHKDELLKIEADIAKARAKYANERTSIALGLSSELYDIDQLGLSDLKKYNQDKIKIDELYNKAKTSLAEGDIEKSKLYYAEFSTLRKRNTGEAIKDDKRILLSQQSASAARRVTAKQDAELLNLYNDDVVKNSIANANKEKEIANAKLLATRTQIQLKWDELKVLIKLQEIASGIKINADLSNFKKALQNADKQLHATANKEREVKLKVAIEKGASEAEIEELQKIIETPPPIPLTFNVQDKAKIKKESNDITDNIEKPKKVSLSFEDFKRLKIEAREANDIIETPAVKPIDADTRPAEAQDTALVKTLSKPVIKKVFIKTVNLPVKAQIGGLIHKFAEGGSPLESGEGHTSRSGKLSGYGGGDKVKALLEAGEFIVRKEAVKSLGLDRLHQINQGYLPKYQTGGVAGQAPLSANTNTNTNTGRAINLNIGGETFTTMADNEVAEALERYTRKNL